MNWGKHPIIKFWKPFGPTCFLLYKKPTGYGLYESNAHCNRGNLVTKTQLLVQGYVDFQGPIKLKNGY